MYMAVSGLLWIFVVLSLEPLIGSHSVTYPPFLDLRFSVEMTLVDPFLVQNLTEEEEVVVEGKFR